MLSWFEFGGCNAAGRSYLYASLDERDGRGVELVSLHVEFSTSHLGCHAVGFHYERHERIVAYLEIGLTLHFHLSLASCECVWEAQLRASVKHHG